MEYIEHFNKAVKRSFGQNFDNKTMNAIEKYKLKFRYNNYYETLESLGFSVGIEFMVQTVIREESDEVIGYIPSLKFHDNNPVTGKFEVVEFGQYNSINKAYEYIVKEQLYRLMRINNIEEILKIDTASA